MSDFTEKEAAFLIELSELTRKHGIAVGGCGCCGSPFLNDEISTAPEAGYGYAGFADFCWIQPDSYEWSNDHRPVTERVLP